MEEDEDIQFLHTIEEQIGGRLQAGFMLTDICGDTNDVGRLYEYNIPAYDAAKR